MPEVRESGISTDEPVKVWKMGRGVSAEDAAGSEEGLELDMLDMCVFFTLSLLPFLNSKRLTLPH